MTFEEFEKADKAKLMAEAKKSFDISQDPRSDNTWQVAKLIEAQIYMTEIDRKSSSRIALRDLILEVVVIILIGVEIVLAIKQGDDQQVFMGKQNSILTNLQQSSSDTAKAMKDLSNVTAQMSQNTSTSAQTLTSLYSTTQTMNKGVHDQIALFYDPSVVMLSVQDQNAIQFVNTGRSGLVLNSLKINSVLQNLGSPKLVPGGSGLHVDLAESFKNMPTELAKGSTKTVPVEAHFQNELGKHFVMRANLYFLWQGDKVNCLSQNTAVEPEP
jgi:hypothetical protein